jgi:hypothetical protein
MNRCMGMPVVEMSNRQIFDCRPASIAPGTHVALCATVHAMVRGEMRETRKRRGAADVKVELVSLVAVDVTCAYRIAIFTASTPSNIARLAARALKPLP